MKDPFRKTPWMGRFLFTGIGKGLTVIIAFVFSDVTLPEWVAQCALIMATAMTIAAVVFMGRVGEMVPGRTRVFMMIALTHGLILFSRLIPRIWQSGIVSVDLMSVVGMITLGLMQIPNIVRAIELHSAEVKVYMQQIKNDPVKFHRCM